MSVRASVLLAASVALAACASDAPASEAPRGVAARVGDAVLTEDDLAQAMGDAAADSAETRTVLIDAFVRRSLLVGAALDENLDDAPDVARELAEARRSVLELAALDRLLDGVQATPEQIAAYYAANPDAFTLDEPAVRIRHLRLDGATATRGAQAAQALGRVADSARPDSTFALAAREISADPAGSVALARRFVPVARLGEIDPALAQAVAGLREGGPATVVTSGPTTHVVQLAQRLPAGARLPLGAVRTQIAERLGVGLRTEAAARLVERLRAEATARGDLVAE